VEILAQSSADFALTQAYNFQGTHILGASRGHLSDSVISVFAVPIQHYCFRRRNYTELLSELLCVMKYDSSPNSDNYPAKTSRGGILSRICYQLIKSRSLLITVNTKHNRLRPNTTCTVSVDDVGYCRWSTVRENGPGIGYSRPH